jgi:hypothetical protein
MSADRSIWIGERSTGDMVLTLPSNVFVAVDGATRTRCQGNPQAVAEFWRDVERKVAALRAEESADLGGPTVE